MLRCDTFITTRVILREKLSGHINVADFLAPTTSLKNLPAESRTLVDASCYRAEEIFNGAREEVQDRETVLDEQGYFHE